MSKKILLLAGLTVAALSACKYADAKRTQSNAKPDFSTIAITNFDINRYMGQWYEVARLDFFWEKNLNNVTATYTLEDDGSVEVDNKGFDYIKQKNKQSIGKAKFASEPNKAALKVSFFGPFYSGYNVVKIDPEYKYALVFGENRDYMWILSREKTIPEEVKQDYLNLAQMNGYDIKKLVWTEQN